MSNPQIPGEQAPTGGDLAGGYGQHPTPPVPGQSLPDGVPPQPEASPNPASPFAAAADEAGPKIIYTDAKAEDGINKCPSCGSSEISLNVATGTLRCHFCRYEWAGENAAEAFNLNTPIGDLRGIVMGSGSADIIPSVSEVVTFKCSACGAEVVIDTAHSMQARCHWCRNVLSANEQIPNGAVPDVVLPFSYSKADAQKQIQEFVQRRKFFANQKFRQEFKAENVLGVYMPYMIVDVNAHVQKDGIGEHKLRSYFVGGEKNRRLVYDADVYKVGRKFDVYVDDLTIESSTERSNMKNRANTNNIINSVMPFDTKNAVRYDANFLSGFTSERRDSNIQQLSDLVAVQGQDIARHVILPTLQFYDRGVRWENEQMEIRGQRWVSAYLPIWLYSYYEAKKDGTHVSHYVAVNGRTGETMGSVPVNKKRLLGISAIVQAIGMTLGTLIMIFA